MANPKKVLKVADIAAVRNQQPYSMFETRLDHDRANHPAPYLAPYTPTPQDAEAGDRLLRLSCCADSLQLGEMVRLLMSDPGDGSLMAELHDNKAPVPKSQLRTKHAVRFLARVVSAGDGAVVLDRPVPVKVRLVIISGDREKGG